MPVFCLQRPSAEPLHSAVPHSEEPFVCTDVSLSIFKEQQFFFSVEGIDYDVWKYINKPAPLLLSLFLNSLKMSLSVRIPHVVR